MSYLIRLPEEIIWSIFTRFSSKHCIKDIVSLSQTCSRMNQFYVDQYCHITDYIRNHYAEPMSHWKNKQLMRTFCRQFKEFSFRQALLVYDSFYGVSLNMETIIQQQSVNNVDLRRHISVNLNKYQDRAFMSACRFSSKLGIHLLHIVDDKERLWDLRDNRGNTPIMIAAKYQPVLFERILKNSTITRDYMSYKNNTGITCAAIAARFNYESVKILVKKKHWKNILFNELITIGTRTELRDTGRTRLMHNVGRYYNLPRYVDPYSYIVRCYETETLQLQSNPVWIMQYFNIADTDTIMTMFPRLYQSSRLSKYRSKIQPGNSIYYINRQDCRYTDINIDEINVIDDFGI